MTSKRGLPMFTIFHLLMLAVPLAAIAVGSYLGWQYFGIAGLMVGGVAGLLLGAVVGALPLVVALSWQGKKLRELSSDELRRHLRQHDCLTPNLLLLELLSRGESIDDEQPIIIDLLASDDSSRRTRGWAAAQSVYPELAERLAGYAPNGSTAACREHLAKWTGRM